MVAETIYDQIFSATSEHMVGVHAMIDHGDGLSFKFKGCRKYNFFKVILKDDLYEVTLCRVTKLGDRKSQETLEGVYWDQLIPIFESKTGLYLSL